MLSLHTWESHLCFFTLPKSFVPACWWRHIKLLQRIFSTQAASRITLSSWSISFYALVGCFYINRFWSRAISLRMSYGLGWLDEWQPADIHELCILTRSLRLRAWTLFGICSGCLLGEWLLGRRRGGEMFFQRTLGYVQEGIVFMEENEKVFGRREVW